MPDELSADDLRLLATDVMGWNRGFGRWVAKGGATYYGYRYIGESAEDTISERDWHPDLDDAQAAMLRREFLGQPSSLLDMCVEHYAPGKRRLRFTAVRADGTGKGVAPINAEALASCLAIYRAVKAGKEEE